MNQSHQGSASAELLPAGSFVDLEMYLCTVRVNGEETASIAVTCDTLRKMIVIGVDTAVAALARSNLPHTPEVLAKELASAFQRTCVAPESERKFWPLNWSELLDRQLLFLVKLEIQPAKGN